MDRILEGHAEDNVFLPSLEVLATEKDTSQKKYKKYKKMEKDILQLQHVHFSKVIQKEENIFQ